MRVKRGIVSRRRHNKIRNLAKGFRNRRKNVITFAKDAVERAQANAYAGRKLKKRDFRKLWITRINAAARQQELSYSRLMHGLILAQIDLDRKTLAALAVEDPAAFADVCERAKTALAA